LKETDLASSRFGVGISLGRPGQFSAIIRVELASPDDGDQSRCVVRDIKRFPPGTNYATIAAAMRADLDEHHPERTDPWPFRFAVVALDITGATTKAVESFAVGDPPPNMVPMSITAGLNASYGESGAWRISRTWLATMLQQFLQQRRLTIPTAIPHASLLAKELTIFRPRAASAVDPAAADWRDGESEDLVFALALAIWAADRPMYDEDFPSAGPKKGVRMPGLSAKDNIRLSDIIEDRVRQSRLVTNPIQDNFGNADLVDRR
jgi:hypothetical protein